MRKLPVPVVKSSTSSTGRAGGVRGGSPTKFERLLLNRSFDEAGPPREGGISRAADRFDQPMRPMDIPVTSVGGLMPPPLQAQPSQLGQVFLTDKEVI